ncbi:hypothetical protein BV22DRAFT_652522 [Leucogyrophana mollusca]|uniref:Uncharacterized protein n=1 Tax=Leucogyrophana mollusca TaxID=85980 RepID=A0ACB8BCD9_9AGAM|nr:hypothetical protein BV22DRAFT_652522 [Leucogyrophana mollusca]
MSPPSPAFADRFRIAIALSALKHKPAGQSTASYILDLRAAFPLAARHDAGDESPDAGAWRTRALKLESELRELQSQHDCNLGGMYLKTRSIDVYTPSWSGCTELASLRTLPPESAPPPKKKAKKSSTSKDISGQPPDIDCLRRDFDRLKDRTWA